MHLASDSVQLSVEVLDGGSVAFFEFVVEEPVPENNLRKQLGEDSSGASILMVR